MPSRKKKFNARFPPARIKKIMQTDEDVGKVAAPVPVIISRALELFIESLILKANEITQDRHAKTLSTAHIKQTIESEKKFDFLRDLVANIPDIQGEDEEENNGAESHPAHRARPGRPRKPRPGKPETSVSNPTSRAASSESSDEEVDSNHANDSQEQSQTNTLSWQQPSTSSWQPLSQTSKSPFPFNQPLQTSHTSHMSHTSQPLDMSQQMSHVGIPVMPQMASATAPLNMFTPPPGVSGMMAPNATLTNNTNNEDDDYDS